MVLLAWGAFDLCEPIDELPSHRRGIPERQHCWDQFGQMGDNYSDRDGPQIAALNRLITRLTEMPE